MRPLPRVVTAAVVLALLAAAGLFAVRWSNGDFSGDYRLTGYFPQAGEGLEPGSEVIYRGVQVGRVSRISLSGTHARVTLLLYPTFRVPTRTKAVIEPVNLFGAEQVTLKEPGGSPGYLPPGGVLTDTATGDELGTLFTAAAPLLAKITTASLSTVVGELAQASNGEGPRIKASIDAGASLAAYFDQTLAAQLAALDSFSSFTAAIAPDGTSTNGLSRQENIALPAFDKEASDYSKLLANLTSFSAELARLLTDYHPTIVTLLSDGANPARVLTAQQTEIGQVIHGAYRYAYKVATAKSKETLPTGSHFVYFATFVMFTVINTLVCDLIAPPSPGLSYLEPLQQALAGSGSAFTCKKQLAEFNSLQAAPAAAANALPIPSPLPAAAPSVPGSSPVQHELETLGDDVYGILGSPSVPVVSTLGSYLKSLLGGSL
jgi:phospholipid/cholesterol/gamma-HCH transport system substrate-binding protein